MNSLTVAEFKSIIKDLKIQKNSSYLLHSSIRGIGLIKGIKILDTPKFITNELLKKIGINGTLSALTPFYDYGLKKKKFDIKNSPSSRELGALSDFIFRDKRSFRSLNPPFSLSSIGKKAKYIAYAPSPTAFGFESSWDRLFKLDSKMIFLGCNLSVCTFVRYIEFRFGVPYLYNKFFRRKILKKGKTLSKYSSSTLRYDYFYLDYNLKNFQIFLKKKGVINFSSNKKIQAMSLSMRDCFEYGVEKLLEDIFFFLDKKPLFIKNKPPIK